MGRPKAVKFKNFAEYNLLHTQKTKMYNGTAITTLYPIKETPEFYRSIEVWAYCASNFKKKKKNVTLNVDIPTITDERTIAFLDENCWDDWVAREIAAGEIEMIETVKMLGKLFPDKNKRYFYELNSLMSCYIQGNLESYDKDGNLKPLSDNDIKRQKYYHHKYVKFVDAPEIKKMRDAYEQEKDEVKHKELMKAYFEAERTYVYENMNMSDIFLQIGKNAVCYPVAFSDGTADWHKEKYGKVCSYSHAGEIFFVVTPDAVYFDVNRHF